ncbi:hypothetical protein [Salinactinospora qingdaonensis]|uniref:Uncharacterized protein n=1 Tax=Salinactinospora qingdaonensis TaxID=702744 RepID=A0ABP7GLG5_9ACTN
MYSAPGDAAVVRVVVGAPRLEVATAAVGALSAVAPLSLADVAGAFPAAAAPGMHGVGCYGWHGFGPGLVVHLYGARTRPTPQSRAEEWLAGVVGAVVVVAPDEIEAGRATLAALEEQGWPYVVAVSTPDPGPGVRARLAAALPAPGSVPVLGCVPAQTASMQRVVCALITRALTPTPTDDDEDEEEL